jgi:hypothetical protein
VAVGAHRNQVPLRVNLILLANISEWIQMMNVNVASAEVTINLVEIESAYNAVQAVPGQACLPCPWVTFISINRDPTDCSFPIPLRGINLFRNPAGF